LAVTISSRSARLNVLDLVAVVVAVVVVLAVVFVVLVIVLVSCLVFAASAWQTMRAILPLGINYARAG
jgi:hypothetical protein